MFENFYRGKRVLITGHTGFKGTWLAAWLERLGANLSGIALDMPSPSHFQLLRPSVDSRIFDIRDSEKVRKTFREIQPELVFHLAAQPLVRASYLYPADTFAVNLMGTVNLLEACRETDSVQGTVIVTSDKCYENPEDGAPFVENGKLGGYDPYSSSKACAELAAAAYCRSFHLNLATARAGNVIGGGDWAPDRLVPDLIRGAVSGIPAEIRNPYARRPWQHVLEPISGYLILGQRLGCQKCSGAWNFGPDRSFPVETAVAELAKSWDKIRWRNHSSAREPHEAKLLELDCSKAKKYLDWHPVWTPGETFRRTADWYRNYYENGVLSTENDLNQYISDAGSAAWKN